MGSLEIHKSDDSKPKRGGNRAPRRLQIRTCVRLPALDRVYLAAKLSNSTTAEVMRTGIMKESEFRIANAENARGPRRRSG